MMVSMKSPMQGLDITVDSKGEDNELNGALKSVVGKSVFVTVDLEGNILKIEGLDEVMNDLQKLEATGGDVMQFFDEEGLEKNYQLLFPITYGKSYEKGSSWELDASSGGDMDIKSVVAYTADEVSKKSFKFSTVTNMTMSGEQEQQGMEMSLEMKGNMKGNGEMSPKTGLLKSYVQEGTITGTTFLEANDQMPMDMEIPMVIEMTSTITVN